MRFPVDPRDHNNCFYILRCIRNGLYINNLYLGTRDLTSKDALQIGAAMKATSVLHILSICTLIKARVGNNELEAEGARYVADGLKENKSIVELSLGANDLGNEGASHIAEALKVNSKLVKLNLGDKRS